MSGGRTWSRPVLAVFVAFLLACAWLVIPASEVPEASGTVDPAATVREVPPPPSSAATKPPDRTPTAEIGTQVAPSPVAGVSRPETLVRGWILGPADAPIRGAWSAGVSFVDHSGGRRTADARQEGTYALHALGFGTHWVTASADGYRSLEETIELRPDRPLMRKDFTLQKAVELRVRVNTPDGKDLIDVLKQTRAPRGARVLVPVATREPPGKRFDEVVGSLNDTLGVGRFQSHGPRVEQLPPGCMGILLLDCDLPVCVSLVHHHAVLQTQRVERGQDEVTFVLTPDDLLAGLATIRVQVVAAETRLPIQGARVMLSGATYSDPGVATDRQGIATIDHREPGRFDLQVRASGYERFRSPIDALPGEIIELRTVVLEPEVAVKGRVLDLEDYPLAASFTLGMLDPLDRSVHWFPHEGFESSGDGSFELRGLGRREYVIRTRNHDARDRGAWEGTAWVSGNLVVDTRAGSITGLEVRLRPASRLVVQVAEAAADGMRILAVDERGLELVQSRLHGSRPRRFDLPAGSYRVSLLDPRGAVLSERSVMLGAEAVTLDLPAR